MSNDKRAINLKRPILFVAFLVIALSLFFLNSKAFVFENFYFDTYVSGKIYARNPILAKNVIKRIKDEFKTIDSLKVQGIKKGIIDTISIKIIERSLYFSGKTDGYFDLTIDPILQKWNYFKNPTLPSQSEIRSLLPLINYKKVKIKLDTLIIPEDFSLNLGGAAKGYALDRAKNILKEYGIHSALIDAGGDVLLVGKKKRKGNWLIGIRNPRGRNEIIGTLSVSDCFVFTSGDYERYFEIEGVRYHHIVDPSTGYPSREIASATIIVKDGIEGDCITTALVAMGTKKAKEYIKNNNLEAVLVDTSKNIYKFISDNKLSIYE
jgi:thiamine biosynthesis lipoprotein